jgi:hypothetical protein
MCEVDVLDVNIASSYLLQIRITQHRCICYLFGLFIRRSLASPFVAVLHQGSAWSECTSREVLV